MGSKLSVGSCVSCKSKKRYNESQFHTRRKLSRSHYRFEEGGYGEVRAPPLVYLNRLESYRSKLKPANDVIRVEDNQRSTVATMEAQPTTSEKVKQTTKEPEKLQPEPQDPSKYIGTSSIEILDCPEMSTISGHNTLERRGSVEGAAEVYTPSDVPRIDDIIYDSEPRSNEQTATSLTVPPNSVNSQFISGITPLESAVDNDLYEDSVFARDDLDYECPPGYYAQYPPGVLINNNSLVAHAPCGSEITVPDGTTNMSSILYDVGSEGPGFDSDFGASAGVEMRIVSSDYSTANNTHYLNVKGRPKQGQVSKNAMRPSPRAQLFASELGRPNSNRPVALPRITFLQNNSVVVGDPGTPRSRPVTVPGPDGSSVFQTTMEWDNYETHYGNWKEYFIPGVTYPHPGLVQQHNHYPVLCKKQHWV